MKKIKKENKTGKNEKRKKEKPETRCIQRGTKSDGRTCKKIEYYDKQLRQRSQSPTIR